MPDGTPVEWPVGVVVIRPVTIEAIASISIWGSGVDPGTAANIGIPPVDIYIPAVVDIYVCIPAALVDIDPVVGIPVSGTGDIGGTVP